MSVHIDPAVAAGIRHALDDMGQCKHWCRACAANTRAGLNPDGSKNESRPSTCYLCGGQARIDTPHGQVCGTSTCASFVIVERDIARKTLDEAEAAHDHLASENAALRAIQAAAQQHLECTGPCDNLDPDEDDRDYCDDETCTYCDLSRAVQAAEVSR
jgi:hypothetical protein